MSNPKIPFFPKFKNLEISDKKEVETITHQFEPYSDYNFVSLWSYNVKEEIQISKLNDNLVIKFTDYISGNPFYSFLGNNLVEDTISKLLKHSKTLNIPPLLKLIPESASSLVFHPLPILRDSLLLLLH